MVMALAGKTGKCILIGVVTSRPILLDGMACKERYLYEYS